MGVDVRDLNNWDSWVSETWNELRIEIGELYGSTFELAKKLYYYNQSTLTSFNDPAIPTMRPTDINEIIDPFGVCQNKYRMVDPDDITSCLGCLTR